jgi:mRNA interferase MazF
MEKFVKGDIVVIPFPLSTPSNIRPNRIFTADKNIIIKKASSLNESAVNSVIQKTISILS